MSATSLLALRGSSLPAESPAGASARTAESSRPLMAAPFATQPGEPVFLLEASTLEDLWAVKRRINPLAKSPRNPVIVKDKEWEGIGPYLYGSVLYDAEDRLFKMWYTVYHNYEYRHHLPGSYLVCYATSEDGYSWRKPDLGVFDWKGSKRNNLIKLAGTVEAITVVQPPAGSGISSRYLAVYLNGGPQGVCLAFSDDGIVWRQHGSGSIEPSHSDTHNAIVYNPTTRKWMVYLRPPVYAGPWKRRIAMMDSQDLNTWARPETVLIPDEEDPAEFYSMPVFRRGNLFWGLLQLFNRPPGTIDEELVFSADGKRWNRVPPRDLFVRRGVPGQFDQGMVLTANAPVVVDHEMRLYYGGFNGYHYQSVPGQTAIGVGSVPLDRFYAMEASDREPGFILSRPLLLNGSVLRMNFRTLAEQGSVKVALLDLDGKEIPGFGFDDAVPATGNEIKHPVSWKSGMAIGRLAKQPVRLKFQLQQAAFYAFYVEPA